MILSIIISLILLVINPSFIYGTLVGSLALIISMFISFVFYSKLKNVNLFIYLSLFFIKTIIFIVSYLLVVLLVNKNLNSSEDILNIFLGPINTFSLLFTYTIPLAAYFTIGIAECFKNKNISK